MIAFARPLKKLDSAHGPQAGHLEETTPHPVPPGPQSPKVTWTNCFSGSFRPPVDQIARVWSPGRPGMYFLVHFRKSPVLPNQFHVEVQPLNCDYQPCIPKPLYPGWIGCILIGEPSDELAREYVEQYGYWYAKVAKPQGKRIFRSTGPGHHDREDVTHLIEALAVVREA